MDFLALIVSVTAIITAIMSTTSASVRNEAHHQTTLMQDYLKEISEATHSYFLDISSSSSVEEETVKSALNKKNMTYELMCSMRCDLLESAMLLLVRRCARMWFFDADVESFRADFVSLLGKLRDALSDGAYSEIGDTKSMILIDGYITKLHVRLNEYIGERFRPIFEPRS
ncbi:hypothetical protein ACIPL1_07635 [Pseudomonas sp. NPDC090202]|uniref:hypothetical protein n=1 Tax=Pseudomonas sp. NPDC090202 TaxID=3364476 RepID=UPI00380AC8F0